MCWGGEVITPRVYLKSFAFSTGHHILKTKFVKHPKFVEIALSQNLTYLKFGFYFKENMSLK